MSAAKPRHFEIMVIGNRCRECSLCIESCPTKVLAVGEKQNKRGFYVTYPRYPSKCIGCTICEYICPDFAIFIRPANEGRSVGKVVWEGGVDLYEG